MAATVTRFSPVYFNSKKLGLVQKVKYTINGAVTQEDTADEIVLAFGKIKTALQLDVIAPPSGPGFTADVQVTGKLQILCAGKLHSFDGTLSTLSQDSDATKGTTTLTYDWVGGEPQKV